MFKNTEFDFTYPKKIANSTIEGEFLTDFPKINYKKICILMGANAYKLCVVQKSSVRH
jgi:hypothetical protein